MNLEIYNLTMGYRSKDDYAEHIAHYYGKNVYCELFESQHIFDPILDVASDIAKFSFKLYDTVTKDDYVKIRHFNFIDKKFYTNWNFHSISDVIDKSVDLNYKKNKAGHVFFAKDSNKKIAHPIFIMFREDNKISKDAAAITRFRKFPDIIDDSLETVKLCYTTDIILEVNILWFKRNYVEVEDYDFERLRESLASYISHELMHVFDMNALMFKDILKDKKKDNILFNVESDSEMINAFENIWNDAHRILYYISPTEQRAFLHGTALFLSKITSKEHYYNDIRKNLIEKLRSWHNGFKSMKINLNRELVNIVLDNRFVRQISYIEIFKKRLDELKTTNHEEHNKKVIALIGYYMFNNKLLNFKNPRFNLIIPYESAEKFFKESSIVEYLKNMSINPMIDTPVSDILDFVLLSVENNFLTYERSLVNVINKYIDEIFNDKYTKVHFDRDYPKNTTVEVEDIPMIENSDTDYLPPEDDKPNSSDEDSSNEYNYVKI